MTKPAPEPQAVAPLVSADRPVLLAGAGPLDEDDLRLGLSLTGPCVAADGGAARLMASGIVPDAVIGDMDSLPPEVQRRLPAACLHRVAEQDSTDFEKCLIRIAAPLVLALGFVGGRIDHLLAVLNAMLRQAPRRCVVIGPEDIALVLPPDITLPLAPGTPVSLFPLAPVAVKSSGLHWPVAGLPFDPAGQIGTSNRATGPVSLRADGPGMVLILPKSALSQALAALKEAPGW